MIFQPKDRDEQVPVSGEIADLEGRDAFVLVHVDYSEVVDGHGSDGEGTTLGEGRGHGVWRLCVPHDEVGSNPTQRSQLPTVVILAKEI